MCLEELLFKTGDVSSCYVCRIILLVRAKNNYSKLIQNVYKLKPLMISLKSINFKFYITSN